MNIFSAKRIIAVLCLFLLVAVFVSIAAAESTAKFTLSAEERSDLEKLRNRPITIAYSYDLVAAEFEDESCRLLDPVLNILENEFGLTVNLVKADWHDAFILVESGEVDFYGPIAISESRRQKYVTSEPFYRSYSKVVTRVDEPINSMMGLYNRSIGLLEGSVISKTLQTYLGSDGSTVYFQTFDDMINNLINGTIDAFATVDNAEFEILRYDDIQFEFSIENFYVDQGFISSREDMRPLATLLGRYIKENPEIFNEVTDMRNQALLRYSQENLADEIAYLQSNYNEVVMQADPTFYPLCYAENGVVKGMILDINKVFEQLTGVNIRFSPIDELSDGLATSVKKLLSDDCMVIAGVHYDTDTWNNPEVQYSPHVWRDTIRTYSYKDTSDNLTGKRLGTTRFAYNYLGWNNTTGNAPVFYSGRKELIDALKNGNVDVIFMSEMRFDYGYSILKDYSLREVTGLSAESSVHMLYSAKNKEFNELFNESLTLFQIIKPQAMGQWKSQSDKYKSDYIRLRYTQQIWVTVVIIIFTIMVLALLFLLRRVRRDYKNKVTILEVIQEKNQIITSSIDYASKIQRNLLPHEDTLKKAFSDYSVIWKPRDVVGGDIYWLKNFDEGTILCVCDCTGHGTPGALLTMLVVSAFETIVNENNYKDTAGIVWELEQRLVTVLNAHLTDSSIKEGCDLAVLFIAKDKSVNISAGHTQVFICDGKEVKQIKGQKIFIGEGKIKSKESINMVTIPANPDNKFYIASDGLYDQIGGNPKRPFGYERFKRIIIENHNEEHVVISEKIWEAFEIHMGDEKRRDDFELITFEP